MADDDSTLQPADALRRAMIEREAAKLDQRAHAEAEEARKRAAFVESFLHGHVGEDERAAIRRLVKTAADRGQTEAMIYSFPSDLCSDGGRAINNARPEWPETLRGKALELYTLCQSVAKPAGYRLTARIVTFPGGMPGDVGFFLSWSG